MANGKKSDDAKLQDAKDAQLNRAAGNVKPEDELDSLTEELQAGAAEAKQAGASDAKVAQLAKNFEALLGIVEGIKNNQQNAINEAVKLALAANKGLVAAPTVASKMKCQLCQQYLSVCNGKHVRMHIMPVSAENVRFFQGVNWNGVNYYGTSVIPEACMHDIASTVRQWEFGERVRQHGFNKVVENGRTRTGLFIFDEAI